MADARVKSLLRGMHQLHKDGYTGVAGSILLKALLDDLGHGKVGARKFAQALGYSSVREEIEAFWHSEWGLWLREAYGVEHLELSDIRRSRMANLIVQMPYIGGVLSVNRYKHHGTHFTRPEVKDWQEVLAFGISHGCRDRGIELGPPLVVTVSARFRDRRRPDLHNLFKVIADAVERGTGVNDRDIEMREGEVSYDKEAPGMLWVEVEEKKDAQLEVF